MNETRAIQEVRENRAPVPVGNRGLSFQTLDDMWRFSTALANSGFAPKGMEKAESLLVAIQMGMEVGLSPMQAVQNIAVINNRPTIWGDAAKALVLGSDLCASCKEWIEGDGEKAVAICEVRRVGEEHPIRQTFSVEDAKRASLWGKSGPWTFFPRRMLQMRARAFALRDAFPDVLKGLHIAEEERDIIDVTPQEVAPEKPSLASVTKRLAAKHELTPQEGIEQDIREAAEARGVELPDSPEQETEPLPDPETGEISDTQDDTPFDPDPETADSIRADIEATIKANSWMSRGMVMSWSNPPKPLAAMNIDELRAIRDLVPQKIAERDRSVGQRKR